MKRPQYIRLTIVLIIPFSILSWWLSQQDFVLKQATLSECSWKENTCFVYSVPISQLNPSKYHTIKYKTHNENHVLLLGGFDAEIEANYYDMKGGIIPTQRITSNTLDSFYCDISPLYHMSKYMYFCGEQDALERIPKHLSTGIFKLKNKEDEEKLIKLVAYSQKQLESYNLRYVWSSVAIFLSLMLIYFITSYLIRFVIYGFKQK